MQSKRNLTVDILRGIGILLMVFNHVRFGHYSHYIIHSFHMPLFMILSGYMYQPVSYSVFFKKKTKSLLKPYFFWALLFFVLFVPYGLLNHQSVIDPLIGLVLFPTDMEKMRFSSPLWFLPALFWTILLYLVVDKITKNKKALKFIAILFLTVLGYVLSKIGPQFLPFAFGPALFSVSFFYFGDLLKQYPLYRFPLILIPVFLAGCLFVIKINGFTDLRSTTYGIFPLFIVTGILVTLCLWNVIDRLNQHGLEDTAVFKATAYIGRFSMVYLCLNYFLITAAKWGLDHFFKDAVTKYPFLFNCAIFVVVMLLITGYSIVQQKVKSRMKEKRQAV